MKIFFYLAIFLLNACSFTPKASASSLQNSFQEIRAKIHSPYSLEYHHYSQSTNNSHKALLFLNEEMTELRLGSVSTYDGYMEFLDTSFNNEIVIQFYKEGVLKKLPTPPTVTYLQDESQKFSVPMEYQLYKHIPSLVQIWKHKKLEGDHDWVGGLTEEDRSHDVYYLIKKEAQQVSIMHLFSFPREEGLIHLAYMPFEDAPIYHLK